MMMLMMMMVLLLIMKNDCYLDYDDDEEEEEEEEQEEEVMIRYIFTIYCKWISGGMNAPNWIFTHLKRIVNAPYLICIAMHFP